jgi:hypothetical protein
MDDIRTGRYGQWRRHLVAGLLRIVVLLACLAGAGAARATLGIDVTAAKDQGTAATSITTPAFSTHAGNELLLAFVAADNVNAAATTVTAMSGAGLTWTLVRRTNAQRGTAEIWRAFAAGAVSSVTVKATLSQAVAASITVMSFTGADPSGNGGAGAIGATGGASAGSGAPSATLTTTRAGSWVLGVGDDWDSATARTPGSGQAMVHQYLAPNGDTFWVQRQNAATPSSGTVVTINDLAPTGDRYNLAIVEVLAAAAGSSTYSLSGTVAPAALGSGTVLTLTGAASATMTADPGGNYAFTGLANGSYTVTPTKSGVTFTPASQAVTISGGDRTAGFTATAPTWTISGTIMPASAGAGSSVSLMQGAATVATAIVDASGAWSVSGMVDGSYTDTPSPSGSAFDPASRGVSVSGANVTGVEFTAHASSGPATIDVTVAKDTLTAASSISSPAFSTAAGNELLLALIATDALAPNMTVTGVSGGGLAWTPVVRTNAQGGTSEIWRAFAPAPLGNVIVTATLSQSVLSSMTVMSFANVDAAVPVGATGTGNSAAGAPRASLTTTRDNSWVVGVGNDYANAVPRTVAAGQTLVHQDLSSTGDTYWVQRTTTPVASGGTAVTIGDTAPTGDSFNLSIVEVLSSGSGGGDTTPPAVAVVAPAPNGTAAGLTSLAADASDNVAVAGVQFSIDGVNIGAELTTPPYYMSWNSAAVANGPHTLAARARDASNLTSTASVTVNVDNTGNPAVVGTWSAPVTLPAVAVNLVLLPNNKLFFYQDGATATVWDYINNRFTSVPTGVNLFCSGHALLADGRVLVVGGFGGSANLFGIANAEIFDPSNNSWTVVPSMAYRRWYPTATTLSDGRVLVTAGWQTTSHTNAGIPEIYDPALNQWTRLSAANNPFETYPFIYQLPDGRVVHVGGSEYATSTETLDVAGQAWTTIDARVVDGSSPAMYLPGRIVKAGSAADSQFSGPSASTTYVLDMSAPAPAWQQAPSMAYPRSFMNMTVLPDGTVLATGGETDKDGGNVANAVYPAELWSPATRTWTTVASMHTPREYHSTALLLPDGRVVQSGMGADFGNVPDELTAEFYSPPYLFKGARPAITQAPSLIHYGAGFTVNTPDASAIATVVLIRNGAVTHFFDQNTRYVPLAFTRGPGTLTVTAPADGRLAQPGHYMLFLVDGNGVPSVAPIVQVLP